MPRNTLKIPPEQATLHWDGADFGLHVRTGTGKSTTYRYSTYIGLIDCLVRLVDPVSNSSLGGDIGDLVEIRAQKLGLDAMHKRQVSLRYGNPRHTPLM